MPSHGHRPPRHGAPELHHTTPLVPARSSTRARRCTRWGPVPRSDLRRGRCRPSTGPTAHHPSEDDLRPPMSARTPQPHSPGRADPSHGRDRCRNGPDRGSEARSGPMPRARVVPRSLRCPPAQMVPGPAPSRGLDGLCRGLTCVRQVDGDAALPQCECCRCADQACPHHGHCALPLRAFGRRCGYSLQHADPVAVRRCSRQLFKGDGAGSTKSAMI